MPIDFNKLVVLQQQKEEKKAETKKEEKSEIVFIPRDPSVKGAKYRFELSQPIIDWLFQENEEVKTLYIFEDSDSRAIVLATQQLATLIGNPVGVEISKKRSISNSDIYLSIAKSFNFKPIDGATFPVRLEENTSFENSIKYAIFDRPSSSKVSMLETEVETVLIPEDVPLEELMEEIKADLS